MALMDLAGKAWGVPCWQMLGGKFRDSVRLYADTTQTPDPKEQAARLKERMDRGITYLKQDFGIGLLRDVPGTLSKPIGMDIRENARVMHPFTGVEITDKGVAWLSDWVGADPRDHRHGESRCPPITTATSASTAASSWPARWRSGTWPGWKTWCPGSSAS